MGCASGLSGRHQVVGQVRSADPEAVAADEVAASPDFARKPGSVPSTTSDGPSESWGPPPSRNAPPSLAAHAAPRAAVHAGAILFDQGVDLDGDVAFGARLGGTIGGGLRAELPLLIAPVTSRRASAAPPSTSAPSVESRDGVVVFVEPGVSRRLSVGAFARRSTLDIGVGAGIAVFHDIGDDDIAPSVRASATWLIPISPRVRAFVDVELRGVFTDVGAADRTLRPIGFAGVGLSWDL